MDVGYINAYFEKASHPWSRHVLVTGIGGARTDFLARWLEQITDHFNSWPSRWTMDVATGATNNDNLNLFNHNDEQLMFFRDYISQRLHQTYDAGSPKRNVSKSHFNTIKLNQVIPEDWHDRFDILQIIHDPTNDQSIANLVWEFIIKTFTGRKALEINDQSMLMMAQKLDPWIDQSLPQTDQDRIKLMEFIFRQQVIASFFVDRYFTIPEGSRLNYISIDYNTLLEPGNSQHIADLLGITISQHHREIFDRAVQAAHSPRTWEIFGREWRYDEILAMVPECRSTLRINK